VKGSRQLRGGRFWLKFTAAQEGEEFFHDAGLRLGRCGRGLLTEEVAREFGQASDERDPAAEGFFEGALQIRIDVLDTGFQVTIEIEIGRVPRGGLTLPDQPELNGGIAIDIFHGMAAAPAPGTPGNTKVPVQTDPELEVGFKVNLPFVVNVHIARLPDRAFAYEPLGGESIQHIGVHPLLPIAVILSLAGLDIKDEAEAALGGDIREPVWSLAGGLVEIAQPFGKGEILELFDEIGPAAGFQHLGRAEYCSFMDALPRALQEVCNTVAGALQEAGGFDFSGKKGAIPERGRDSLVPFLRAEFGADEGAVAQFGYGFGERLWGDELHKVNRL